MSEPVDKSLRKLNCPICGYVGKGKAKVEDPRWPGTPVHADCVQALDHWPDRARPGQTDEDRTWDDHQYEPPDGRYE